MARGDFTKRSGPRKELQTDRLCGVPCLRIVASKESGPSSLRFAVMRSTSSAWHFSQTSDV